jgi:uncharacterized membrane protein YesL
MKIKENEILLFSINLVGFLFSISYIILYNVGIMALGMSETAFPLGESGISVMLLFGKVFYVVGMFYVLGTDVAWTLKWWNDDKIRQNEGWL